MEDQMFVVPVPFAIEGAKMLQHTKWLLEEKEEDGSSLIAIDRERFHKLVTALRTTVANEYKLDKELTSYNDIWMHSDCHYSSIRGVSLMFDNSSIHFRALVTIVKGKREEYKKLVQEMSRAVEANEPGTLHYQFYLNRDETKCIVNEIYANSEATLAHINGVASQTILPKIHNVSRISTLEVYGNPSEELQKVLADVVSQAYIPFAGFSR
jgi:quinol monooxygenase YgiN